MKHDPNPVRFEDDIMKHDPNPVSFEDDMWWFWDEIWVNRYGPFETEEEATDACVEYCKRELGDG